MPFSTGYEEINGNEMIVPVRKLKRVNGSWNVNHIINS